jgi:hypothetical protein
MKFLSSDWYVDRERNTAQGEQLINESRGENGKKKASNRAREEENKCVYVCERERERERDV